MQEKQALKKYSGGKRSVSVNTAGGVISHAHPRTSDKSGGHWVTLSDGRKFFMKD